MIGVQEDLTPADVAKKIQEAARRIEADIASGHASSTRNAMDKAYWWSVATDRGEFFYRRVSEILVSEAVKRNCAGIVLPRTIA